MTVFSLLVSPALAADTSVMGQLRSGLNTAAAGYGKGGPTDLTIIIGNLISVVLGILGAVLLFYLIYAGFLWMTAQGDEGKVKKAKDTIKNAIIGLIIVTAAYSISDYVIRTLGQQVFTGGSSVQDSGNGSAAQ